MLILQCSLPVLSQPFLKPVCKVIYPKYSKHSVEYCYFFVFGQIGPSQRAVLKMSVILVKYPTFEGSFSIFSWTKANKQEFLYIVDARVYRLDSKTMEV